MNNLNSVLIEGTLVQEPVYKLSPKGTAICTFSLVSHRYYSYEEKTVKETNYFDIETWSKLAEQCRYHGRKGYEVRIVGRLKQARWNDAQGKSHTRVLIIAEHLEFKTESQPDSVRRTEQTPSLITEPELECLT
ncbi:MAG: single-stranded DNA-binding protein [Spirochaetaceae bacterium]|jgi:single-strand DNA-binding protein|nr:single-stranded DNA-binding protein [Spirochaetaceae bacterium]